MYTYRISVKSNFADIEGTFSQETTLTLEGFYRLIRGFLPSDDETDESALDVTDKGDWFYIYCGVKTHSGSIATAECELID